MSKFKIVSYCYISEDGFKRTEFETTKTKTSFQKLKEYFNLFVGEYCKMHKGYSYELRDINDSDLEDITSSLDKYSFLRNDGRN